MGDPSSVLEMYILPTVSMVGAVSRTWPWENSGVWRLPARYPRQSTRNVVKASASTFKALAAGRDIYSSCGRSRQVSYVSFQTCSTCRLPIWSHQPFFHLSLPFVNGGQFVNQQIQMCPELLRRGFESLLAGSGYQIICDADYSTENYWRYGQWSKEMESQEVNAVRNT